MEMLKNAKIHYLDARKVAFWKFGGGKSDPRTHNWKFYNFNIFPTHWAKQLFLEMIIS